MIVRKAPRRRALLAAASVLWGAAVGCSDQDGSSGGTGPGAGGGGPLDSQTVEQQALSTLDFVNGLVNGVDEMAAGDLSNVSADLGLPQGSALRAQEPAWVPAQGAWILQAQATEVDSTGSASYDVYFWLQFRDGAGIPQQLPDSTTAEMEIQVALSLDAHAEDQGSVFDLSLAYDTGMTVGGLPAGPYTVAGDGTVAIAMRLVGDGLDTGDVRMAASWTVDVVQPPNDGCPSGEATISVDEWTLAAVYDGAGGCAWTLFEQGVKVDEGRELLGCVPPVS